MNELKRYTEYLLKRPFVGSIYRRYYLYPKINRLIYGSLLNVGYGIGDMLCFRENSIGVDINPYNVGVCKANNLDAQLMRDSNRQPLRCLLWVKPEVTKRIVKNLKKNQYH